MPPEIDWTTWRPASCLPRCFHEADHGGAVRQPANTFSSLAFALVGLAVVVAARRSRVSAPRVVRPALATSPLLAALFAFSLVAIGLGSAFFHASLTFVGQTADVTGMYLLATFTIVHARMAHDRPGRARALRLYALLNGALLVLLIVAPAARRWLFALLLAVGFALEWQHTRRTARSPTRLLRSLGVLLLAFAVWVVDVLAWPLPPTHWLQGHALWHVLGAYATWELWRHYNAPSAHADRAATA
ncbi:MAG: ceramidase [Gemmatimonadaceae bacterium]|nr:ceramidase [Gemmatimonadaceae bacterium]